MFEHEFNAVSRELCAFEIDTKPVGKGRPRFTRNGAVYTPEATAAAEKVVRWNARIAMQGKQPTDNPVCVALEFHFAPTRSISEKKRAALIGQAMTKKPDIDNLVKLVFDAMNRIVWMDDKQVSSLTTKKVYSETSKVIVKVYELSE
jgi:Holliday junction resolvase RusA-like endonuclease